MQKIMRMSDVLGLESKQENLSFANVVASGQDNRLFLDGLLISENDDVYSKEYNLAIIDFYKEIYKKLNLKPIDEVGLRKMFSYSKENNANRLGLSKLDTLSNAPGKGCSSQMLFNLFTRPEILDLVRTKVISETPTNINMFVSGFDKDRMSDLLMSIGLRVLTKFTEDQIKMAEKVSGKKVKMNPIPKKAFTWNYIKHKWEPFTYNEYLDHKNRPFILVPKNMVTGSYVYSAKRYIRGHMLLQIQQEMLEEAKKLDPKAAKVKIDAIYEEYRKKLGINSKSYKEFLREYATKFPNDEFLRDFRESDKFKNTLSSYGRLNDDQLERIIMKPYRMDA